MGLKYKENQSGFMTLEIVLCFALAAFFIFGVVELVFANQLMSQKEQNNAASLGLAQTAMSEALSQGFNFIAPADKSSGGFTEHLEADWLTDYAKEVTSSISYNFSGQTLKTELRGLVTDPSRGLGSDTCALNFMGNWQNPVLRGTLSIGANNPATDADGLNGKVYLTANGATASLNDFYIINADPDHPSIIRGVNTGPGLNALHVAGDYAFAANSSINGQLQIIKISDPNNPTVMLNVPLPGAGSSGLATSIYYYKNRVYVGTAKNTGPELYVYDVTNPLAPYLIGTFEVDSGVSKIYVYGNYAYIATGDVNKFRILNVSNPSHITVVGNFSGIGGTAQSGESLAMLGGKLIFGRAGGLPNAHIPELYLLDVNNSANIQTLNSADVNMSINDIFLRGGMAFMATNKTGGQFQIFSYANNQLNPVASAALNSDAIGLDCEGENFYTITSGDPALQIISPRFNN